MPIRTCLVTGEKREQSQLLRFTVQAGKLVFDAVKTPGKGRGGYVLRDGAALDKLAKLEKKLTYFLKKSVKIEREVIEEQKRIFKL